MGKTSITITKISSPAKEPPSSPSDKQVSERRRPSLLRGLHGLVDGGGSPGEESPASPVSPEAYADRLGRARAANAASPASSPKTPECCPAPEVSTSSTRVSSAENKLTLDTQFKAAAQLRDLKLNSTTVLLALTSSTTGTPPRIGWDKVGKKDLAAFSAVRKVQLVDGKEAHLKLVSGEAYRVVLSVGGDLAAEGLTLRLSGRPVELALVGGVAGSSMQLTGEWVAPMHPIQDTTEMLLAVLESAPSTAPTFGCVGAGCAVRYSAAPTSVKAKKALEVGHECGAIRMQVKPFEAKYRAAVEPWLSVFESVGVDAIVRA